MNWAATTSASAAQRCEERRLEERFEKAMEEPIIYTHP
jgi:hypothetical protein